MPGRLEGKVVAITGAASGIGKAIAVLFAREGARTGLIDVDADAAADVAAEIGKASAYHADVGDQQAVLDVFGRIRNEIGPVDALINNAGISHIGRVETTSEEDFDRLYRVNVKGVYNCLKVAVEQMKGRGGSIVNMASVVSAIGLPDRFAYSMTKGAVLTMTLSVACDYLEDGIRCNAIAPARIHTPFVDGFLARNYPGREEDMFEKLSKTQPIGRMGTPEEVARLALYLASDESSFITGTLLPIDGGMLTLRP